MRRPDCTNEIINLPISSQYTPIKKKQEFKGTLSSKKRTDVRRYNVSIKYIVKLGNYNVLFLCKYSDQEIKSRWLSFLKHSFYCCVYLHENESCFTSHIVKCRQIRNECKNVVNRESFRYGGFNVTWRGRAPKFFNQRKSEWAWIQSDASKSGILRLIWL